MQILCKLGHSQINWGKKSGCLSKHHLFPPHSFHVWTPPPFPIHFETSFPVAVKRDFSRETNHPSTFQVGCSSVHSAVGRGSGEGLGRSLGLTAGLWLFVWAAGAGCAGLACSELKKLSEWAVIPTHLPCPLSRSDSSFPPLCLCLSLLMVSRSSPTPYCGSWSRKVWALCNLGNFWVQVCSLGGPHAQAEIE